MRQTRARKTAALDRRLDKKVNRWKPEEGEERPTGQGLLNARGKKKYLFRVG